MGRIGRSTELIRQSYRIIVSVAGAGWSLATFFVVPVLVMSGRLTRRSGSAALALAFLLLFASAARAASDSRNVYVVDATGDADASAHQTQTQVQATAGELNEWFRKGLEQGAPCYHLLMQSDARELIRLATWDQLFGNDAASDRILGGLGRQFNGDVAALRIHLLGGKYFIFGFVADGQSITVLARGERTTDSVDALIDQAQSLGQELGRKLPCYVAITGKRVTDLAKLLDDSQAADSGPAFAAAILKAVGPFAMGSVPAFTGTVTETDSIVFPVKVSDDDATITGQAAWKASIDAPAITMTSKEMDASSKRAPYRLSFTEDVSAPYDQTARRVRLDTTFSDRQPESGGAGSVDVTFKDQMAALSTSLIQGLAAFDKYFTGEDPTAKAMALANTDPHCTYDIPRAPHGRCTLPDPNFQDSAYFRLAADINLREEDDARVTGTDAMGSFDYVVRILTKPPAN